ncbi:MAG: peptidoglycan DD-metalloendopeptidase family protein [Clostridia bacterium]|nr:peptidoglycan DD-metalloendopeptidase family protein [Clostridia bacterium]
MQRKKFVKVFTWLVLIIFVLVTILSVMPVGTSAETAQERLNRARKEQEELQRELDANQEKRNDEQRKKDLIDADVAEIEAEIAVLDAEIEVINDRIEEKDAELAAAHELSSMQYESYKERVKLIVEKGPLTYLEVVMNANSIEDFFVRMDVVEQIAEYDNALLAELRASEQRIEQLKAEIEAERAVVMEKMEESQALKRELVSRQQASQQILDELAASDREITAEMKQAKQAEQEAQREIARLVSGDSSRYVGGKFLWPSRNYYTITSPYSMRVHPTLGVYKQHTGIDIGAAHGTDVLAAADGTVIIAGWNNAYGNYVVINHGGGVTTLYGHNSSLCVSKGQKVSQGQVIAKVGSTGYSTGPHIHFEVQVNGSPVNPMSYLQ